MKKRGIALILSLALIFSCVSVIIPVGTFAADASAGEIIEARDIPLRLYYDEEASHGVDSGYDDVSESFGSDASQISKHLNDDWERWSIPLGNGYFGANIFGRTETERIQLTDKTLANPYYINSISMGGVNNFSETYIDFGHTNSAVKNYSRVLDLKTAVSTVSYVYNGVTYTREYFTSYPDRAMVIKLDASAAGALDFVLRPTIPYEQEYMNSAGDRGGKTGTVTSSVDNGVGSILLSGTLEYFDIDFAGMYTVVTDGTGTVSATTCTNADGDTDGTITVSGAQSAYIIINLGTDYVLSSETFTSATLAKPTFSTDLDDAIATVDGYKAATLAKTAGMSYEDGYSALKSRHISDYSELFGRVSLDLNCKESDFALTTDVLLENYKNGSGSTYLEALYFQYGRYLLIASSRSGALPANLQGTWNRYNKAPWSAGFWHNINEQMNYWPAFSTNLAETFEAYVQYNDAYMAKAEQGATQQIQNYNSSMLNQDGGNGWSIETGAYPNDVYGSSSLGNLGFTTQLFWEYYSYTNDKAILREVVYPVLVSAARFITKMVKEDADGNYIAIYTDSPEQYVNGVWYYTDKGTAYAQSFAYQNNYNMLLAAKELGISFDDTTHEDYAIIQRVLTQIDKYDPIRVGLSGQVKEFFEEDYYSDLGEYTHRHISQLVGLYPGNVINGTTPAWMDAAEYTLTERGDEATGWGVAHRLNLWARVQNGERAHDLLNQLLSVNTATNLWDLHPPFQIDGNLGGTSGISEMLLQSHAGYIEPLAAIPSAWADGSYTGLVARGNFEVAAKWADGIATCFNITSLSGGEVSVKYDGIEKSVVTDSNGKAVSYTAKNGIITFATEEGQTYIISNFEKQSKPSQVTGLAVDAEFLSTSTLTWNASSDATSYNVYVAKDSAPAYTLLANTRATSYVYNPEDLENSRLTFAVTAVNANGVESERALVYRNPDDTSAYVNAVSANVVDGELQVAIDANDYAGTFKLYSRAGSAASWELVSEGTYPIIIYSDYNKSLQYGVSVVSYFGGESEVTMINSYNQTFDEANYSSANILLGEKFIHTATGDPYKHGSIEYGWAGKLTDGNFVVNQGRYSTKASANDIFEVYVNLPTTYMLGELKIYDFQGSSTAALYMGAHLKVDAAVNGVWTTVAEYNSNADILALRKSDANGSYIAVDLSLVKAQQIRIRIDSPIKDTEQRSISINEIECTGVAPGTGAPYVENLLLNKTASLSAESLTWMVTTASGEQSMIEGITDGTYRYSENVKHWRTWYGKENMTFDATFDLSGVAKLGELRIYPYSGYWESIGPEVKIYYYKDGAWTAAHEVTLTGTDPDYRREERVETGSSYKEVWYSFDMSGIDAEKVRIYLPPKSTSGKNYGVYEITLDGYYTASEMEYSENMLLGATPYYTDTNTKVSFNATYGTYGFDKLTDDGYTTVHGGRFSIDAGTGNYATVAYSFHGKANLETLTIWDFYDGSNTPRSNETTIEFLVNGTWVKYMDAQPLYTDAATTSTSGNGRKITFDVSSYRNASAIRLTFKNTNNTDGVTIQEIQLSGSVEPVEAATYADDVFTGYQFAPTDSTASANIWSPNTYDKITDDGATNDSNCRFATANGHTADGTLDFGGKVMELHTLTVNFDPYTATRCGQDFSIYVYYDGKWTQALNHVHSTPVLVETFDLGGVLAEKIRFTVSGKYAGGANADGNTGDCIVIYEMSCTGFEIVKNSDEEIAKEDPTSNILLGTTNDQLTLSGATIHSGTAVKNLENAFDGKLDTRYAVWDASPYSYTLEIDLNGTYPLHTLSFYPFFNAGEASRSDNTYVEIYRDGVWIRIAEGVEILPSATPTTVSIGGIKASKLRIGFANTKWTASATIFEIQCTTGSSNAIDRSALLDAYKALESVDVSGSFGFDAAKDMRLEELKELLMDTSADKETIDGYVSDIVTAQEKLVAGSIVTDAYGDFESYNLSLTGDIGFNFYGAFAKNIATAFPNAFVYVEYADGTVENMELSKLDKDANGRYIIKLNMAAAQMSDAVKMRVIFDGSNCGEYIDQSIKNYANAILSDTSYEANYPGITNLIKSMLNYGGYAQIYFDYNSDDLANADIDQTLEDVTVNDKISSTGTASGISLQSWTLSLETKVEMKIYFKLAEGYDMNNYVATVMTPAGETLEAQIVKTDSRYRVMIEDIPSGYLDDTYTVVISNVNDGTSITVQSSAMCYASYVLANSQDAKLVDLIKSLKMYSDAANVYYN